MNGCSTADAGCESIEHTADVALKLWGRDEPAMLLAAAEAVVQMLDEGATRASNGPA
ncbi:MAG: hypothetical protein AAGA54_22690 [Myxococcota bacterium]